MFECTQLCFGLVVGADPPQSAPSLWVLTLPPRNSSTVPAAFLPRGGGGSQREGLGCQPESRSLDVLRLEAMVESTVKNSPALDKQEIVIYQPTNVYCCIIPLFLARTNLLGIFT